MDADEKHLGLIDGHEILRLGARHWVKRLGHETPPLMCEESTRCKDVG